MPISAADLADLIRRRRSVSPRFYAPEQTLPREVIEQLLENARWAPTHKLTQPWRFRVFHSPESRRRLSDFLADYYLRHTPEQVFSEEKMTKQRENPLRAAVAIALVLHRDPAESLPEFEEIASVAMAVQNMWLSATALGLGCYWSTPQAAFGAGEFLGLAPNERCLGFFYLGRPGGVELPPARRDPISEKTIWL